jgi:outer membrane protein
VGNVKTLVLVLVASFFAAAPMGAIAADKVAVVDIARAIFGSDAAQAKLKQAEQGADFVSLKANMKVQRQTCRH